MHGFTRAEARLASMLAEGITLEGAAEALSISIHTVRCQLKSVFAKTGVTRQAELVALLLAGRWPGADERGGGAEGMAATGRSLHDLARTDPRGLREATAPLADSPAGMLASMAASMPAADQAILAARAPAFEADVAEALRNGVEGFASDFVLAAGEWAFPLAQIRASVDLWIGTEDRNMPPAMTRHLASVLPHSQPFELPGEGHLCLYTHWPAILDRLLT